MKNITIKNISKSQLHITGFSAFEPSEKRIVTQQEANILTRNDNIDIIINEKSKKEKTFKGKEEIKSAKL